MYTTSQVFALAIVFLSFFGVCQNATAQTIPTETVQTIASGNWNTPGVWSSGAVPTSSAHVLILHTITLDSDATVRSVRVSNASGVIARLTIMPSASATSDITLTLTESTDYSVTVTGSTSNEASLLLSQRTISGNTYEGNINALGPVYFSRTCACNSTIRIRVGDGSTFNAGSFIGEYEGSSGGEGVVEFQIAGTSTVDATDLAVVNLSSISMSTNLSGASSGQSNTFRLFVDDGGQLIVSGNVTLESKDEALNTSQVQLMIGNASTDAATAQIGGDLILNLDTNDGTPGDSEVFVNGSASTSLVIAGSLTYNSAANSSTQDLNVTLSNAATLTCNNLRMNSSGDTDSFNNTLDLSGTNHLTINGDIFFNMFFTPNDGGSESDRVSNAIEMTTSSIFEIKGNVYSDGNTTTPSSSEGRIYFSGANTWAVFSGNVQQTIPEVYDGSNFTNSGDYKNLRVNNTSGALVLVEDDASTNESIIIEGQVDMIQGVVSSTSTNFITFASTATSPNTTFDNDGNYLSFITGPVEKAGTTNLVLPLGKRSATVDYWAPIEINAYSGGSSSTRFQVEYLSNAHSDRNDVSATIDHVSGKEYWMFDHVSGTTPTSVSVVLHWKNACFSVINSTTSGSLFAAGYYGSQWTTGNTSSQAIAGSSQACVVGGGNEIGSVSATFSSLSTLTNVTFAAIDVTNPLPIALIYFKANPTGEKVQLEWKSGTEINNAYYILERSTGSSAFEKLTTIDAVGNSNYETYYGFLDENPLPCISYYKLSQVDIDGTTEDLKIQSVDMSQIDSRLVVYPNPSTKENSEMTISVVSPCNENEIQLQVYDSNGRKLADRVIDRDTKLSVKDIGLKEGIYTFQVSFGNRFISQQVFIR